MNSRIKIKKVLCGRKSIALLRGDCLKRLKSIPSDSIDAVITDPPYHLTTGHKGGMGPASVNLNTPQGRARITGFMGKSWDGGDVAFQVKTWKRVLRVAKPGAYLLAFGGARTFHRLACAIEDAGWEIRDCVMWVYSTGFPKSLDVSKAIDKKLGKKRKPGRPYVTPEGGQALSTYNNWQDESIKRGEQGRRIPMVTDPITNEAREWQGWHTALKPAWEPIIIARKPLEGTVADNVLEYGTGAMNIDGCRVRTSEGLSGGAYSKGKSDDGKWGGLHKFTGKDYQQPKGRWPANLIHDGGEEVTSLFPSSSDSGSAARFFYCAKASRSERNEGMDNPNMHPCVKPIKLMKYLVKLVTRRQGIILDPFMGSGSTGVAAVERGRRFIGIERVKSYLRISRKRIGHGHETPIRSLKKEGL